MATTLIDQAARLFPDNESLRAKWLKAVAHLRSGRGWVHDGTVGYRLPEMDAAEPAPPKQSKVLPILRKRG